MHVHTYTLIPRISHSILHLLGLCLPLYKVLVLRGKKKKKNLHIDFFFFAAHSFCFSDNRWYACGELGSDTKIGVIAKNGRVMQMSGQTETANGYRSISSVCTVVISMITTDLES